MAGMAAPAMQTNVLRRRRAHFTASSYSPTEPRNPMALPFSISDAYKWWDTVQTLFPFEQYSQDTAPSRQSIFAALDEIIATAKPGDVFFWLWNGHGAQIPIGDVPLDRKLTVPTDNSGFAQALVPDWATTMNDFVIDTELFARIRKLPAGVKMLVCMDCCHSATLLNMRYTVELDPANPNSSTDPVLTTYTNIPELDAEIVCLSASHDNEDTFDNPITQAAIFGSAARAWLAPAVSLNPIQGSAAVPGTYGHMLQSITTYVRTQVARLNTTYPYSMSPRPVPHCTISFSRSPARPPSPPPAPHSPTTLDRLLAQTVMLLPHWNGAPVAKFVQNCLTNDSVFQFYNTTQYTDGTPPTILSNRVNLYIPPPPPTGSSSPSAAAATYLSTWGIVPKAVVSATLLDPWYTMTYQARGPGATLVPINTNGLLTPPMDAVAVQVHRAATAPALAPAAAAAAAAGGPAAQSRQLQMQPQMQTSSANSYLHSWKLPKDVVCILFDDPNALDGTPPSNPRKVYVMRPVPLSTSASVGGSTKQREISHISLVRNGFTGTLEAVQLAPGWSITLKGADSTTAVATITRSMGHLTSNLGFRVLECVVQSMYT